MRIEELEREIQKLDRVELAHLAQWFQNYASDEWDRQIERDIRSGKLNALAEEAYEEHRTVANQLAEDTTVDYGTYRKDHRFVVDEDGKRQSVVMPIEEYLQILEDMQDLAIIAERNDEPTEPLEVVLERLRKGEKGQ